MTLYLRSLAAVLLAGAMSACGSDTLAPSPATLDGAWARLDDVPGSSEHWDLVVNGSAITGTGTWTGEACCDGTVTLAGTIAGDSIHVDATLLVVNPPQSPRSIHEHFDGALLSRTLLRGRASADGGQPGVERFARQ